MNFKAAVFFKTCLLLWAFYCIWAIYAAWILSLKIISLNFFSVSFFPPVLEEKWVIEIRKHLDFLFQFANCIWKTKSPFLKANGIWIMETKARPFLVGRWQCNILYSTNCNPWNQDFSMLTLHIMVNWEPSWCPVSWTSGSGIQEVLFLKFPRWF